jgi:hypothetical protein
VACCVDADDERLMASVHKSTLESMHVSVSYLDGDAAYPFGGLDGCRAEGCRHMFGLFCT